MAKKQKVSEGQMFFHTEILDAYRLTRDFAGKDGRVATMPEVIEAKAMADEMSLLWTKYITTSSGEFYGKSREGNPIIVVAHGIDGILNDESIIARSTRNLRENSYIQLTPEQFRVIEDGNFGDVTVLDLSQVVNMRQYPSSVLNFDQAMEDPLLRARLGESTELFLEKHREITQKESGNDYVLTNDHRYPYVVDGDLHTGGLLHIGQLFNVGRGGDESSVSSEVDVADLSSAGRFIAVLGKGKLGKVGNDLELILSDLGKNWQKIAVPNDENGQSMYRLMEEGDETFVMYEKKGAGLDSGLPKHHVVSLEPVDGVKQFQTNVGGYHGFFKYGIDEVRAIAPEGANVYDMGEPQVVLDHGDPIAQVASIRFYRAKVDTSRRILRPEEIKKDASLVRTLLNNS